MGKLFSPLANFREEICSQQGELLLSISVNSIQRNLSSKWAVILNQMSILIAHIVDACYSYMLLTGFDLCKYIVSSGKTFDTLSCSLTFQESSHSFVECSFFLVVKVSYV